MVYLQWRQIVHWPSLLLDSAAKWGTGGARQVGLTAWPETDWTGGWMKRWRSDGSLDWPNGVICCGIVRWKAVELSWFALIWWLLSVLDCTGGPKSAGVYGKLLAWWLRCQCLLSPNGSMINMSCHVVGGFPMITMLVFGHHVRCLRGSSVCSFTVFLLIFSNCWLRKWEAVTAVMAESLLPLYTSWHMAGRHCCGLIWILRSVWARESQASDLLVWRGPVLHWPQSTGGSV